MATRSALAGGIVAAVAIAGSANAVPISWNQFSGTFTTGATAGSASGVAGTVGVSYSGEVENLFPGYPSWNPSPPTFSGNTVDNAPVAADGIVQLFGGGTAVDTITFSAPVTNPVLAIWSLGSSGAQASFTFTPSESFTIESGGASVEYGGQALTAVGNTIFGSEGNGVIQFNGTFTSLSWTNSQSENWYGFDVGVPTSVPEPASWALMIGGMGLAGVALRRRAGVAVA